MSCIVSDSLLQKLELLRISMNSLYTCWNFVMQSSTINTILFALAGWRRE